MELVRLDELAELAELATFLVLSAIGEDSGDFVSEDDTSASASDKLVASSESAEALVDGRGLSVARSLEIKVADSSVGDGLNVEVTGLVKVAGAELDSSKAPIFKAVLASALIRETLAGEGVTLFAASEATILVYAACELFSRATLSIGSAEAISLDFG